VARPPRLEIAGGIYHLLARGNERRPIFADDADRRRFLELLSEVKERYRWRVLCYCLMGNHYHLLAQTPEPNLARGMRQLNGVYAQSFNRRHARVGHLLQGRYSARLVQADGYLLAATRYIVRNPVRAGLCRSPGEWRWSSHRATLGQEPPWLLDVAGLLAYYAPRRDEGRRLYRASTEEAGEETGSLHPLVAGDDAFIASTLERLERTSGVPGRYYRRPRPPLPELLAQSDGDPIARAHAHGYGVREIARYLGCHASTVSRRLKRARAGTLAATNGT
jgi:REP element-mobilizing transposase RayT